MKFMYTIFKTFVFSLILIGHVEIGYAQTASILPPAKTTFSDQNGKPLVSGTVDFYIPGTTTRKMTWKDAGQSVPNSNPVILDSSGRATILGDGSYRQVVKDRYGNIIWDAYTSSAGSSGGGTTPTVGDGDAVGTVKAWSGFIAPYGYVSAYGQELVRTSYPEAFAVLTSQQNVSCSSGSPTLTGVGATTQLPIGSPIESSCLNSGATIISKTTSTVTASSNAIISTTTTARFFPFGNGDGSLTFNVPDLRGRVIAGNDIMGGVAANRLTSTYFGASADALGASGGTQSHTLIQAELPAVAPTGSVAINDPGHTHSTTNLISSSVLTGAGGTEGYGGGGGAHQQTINGFSINTAFTGITATFNGNNLGSGSPLSIVQPTQTYNYIIKVIPDTNPNSFFGVASIGGMYGVITCGTGITCTGNEISAVFSTLPTPTPTTLGGVFQSTAPANEFVTGVDLAGNLTHSGGATTVNGQTCAIGGACSIPVGVPVGTSGQIQYNNSGAFGGFTASGDATINTSTGNVIVTKTNGIGFSPSATTDTTNASNIASGTLNTARLPSPFTSGTIAGNTSNFATVSGSATSGNCVQFDPNGNITAASSPCGSGGSGAQPYVMPSDFGITCDGTTDWHTQLQAMINASAGKTIYIPPGPACFSSVTLTLPSNTSITGGGRDVSILKSSANPAISITNQSNISLTNFEILGTNAVTQWLTSTTGPVALIQDSSATAAGSSFTFTGMTFAGFNSSYWFFVSTQSSTFPLYNVTINNNQFLSVAANIPTDANHINNTNYFLVLYSNTAGNGQITNLDVSNNYMDANSMCFGIQNFANTYKFRFANNKILNPGVTAPVNHCTNGLNATNAYGISVYDLNADGNPATDGIVSGNYILNPQASGIYWVGNPSTALVDNTTRSSITNNLIVGETYSDLLLPRGAIVVANTTDVSIIGNSGYVNQTCINLHGQNAGEVSVQSNHCESNAGGAIGMQMSALVSGTANASRLDILSNYFSAPTAVQYQSSSGGKFNNVSLANNTLIGSTSNLSAANQFFIGYNNVLGNSLWGAGGADVSGQTGGLTALNNNFGLSVTLTGVASPASGSSVYMSDAAPGTNPCTAGSGAAALRQVGKWVCY